MPADSDASVAPPESGGVLLSYITALRRRRLAFAICLVAAVAAGIVYSAVKKPEYQASAQVLISRQNLANALTNTPDPNQSSNDFLRIVATRSKVARSPLIAARVVTAFPGMKLSPQDFLGISSVEPVQDADLLLFSVHRGDRASAMRLANAYAKEFVDYTRQLDTLPLTRALDQLSARLKDAGTRSADGGRLLTQLTEKQEELRTLEALQTANATLVAQADTASQIAPRPVRYIGAALVAGILLGFLVVIALEALDTRVRSAADAEDELGARLLGYVPPPPSDVDGLLTLNAPSHAEAEAFRILRTSLEFAALDLPTPRTLMVTSSIEGEGKTTTISNLAVTLARSGQRVVLVDLDLRQPTVHNAFGVPQVPGITDVVRRARGLDETFATVDLEARSPGAALTGDAGTLRVLTAGTLPPDPGEFVTRDALAAVLTQVAGDADVVLIDAPPTLPVGDAIALSGLVDGIFVVVRLRAVRRGTLQALRRSLAPSVAPILGMVVTGTVGPEMSGYAYAYGYGSDPAPAADSVS